MNPTARPGPTASSPVRDPDSHAATSAPRDNRLGDRARGLARLSASELERVFQRGETPDLATLAGWEFRGTNAPAWSRLAGLQKFMKGFQRRGDELYGYNCPIVQNGLDAPWIAKPDDANPKRFGFYRVDVVDPTARDNVYLHAVLLDYGRGGNARLDPTAGLRDYLVRIDRDDDDLFLGKAYYALGPLRVPVGFFLLERHRRGLTDVALR